LEFLIQRRACTLEALRRVAEFQSALDMRFGQLASIRGFLRPTDIVRILAEQVDSDLAFGELCVRNGMISPSQRDELLVLQRDSFRLFCGCLVWSGAMESESTAEALREFESRLLGAEAVALVQDLPDDSAPARPLASVRAILRRIKEVGALPQLVQRTLEVLDGPDPSVAAAAKLIEADPVMSVQMLRIANSALFALRGKVTNVRRATVMLGTRGTRQAVLSTAVADMFARVGGEKGRRLWIHSIQAGRWAAALARRAESSEVEDAATAGIVHEFGTVVLHQYFPNEMARIETLRNEGKAGEREAELGVIGATHSEVGAFLCHQWTFPSRIVDSVLHHHAPPSRLRGLDPLARLVHASCRLAELDLDTAPELWQHFLGEEFLSAHALSTEILARLAPTVRGQVEGLASALS